MSNRLIIHFYFDAHVNYWRGGYSHSVAVLRKEDAVFPIGYLDHSPGKDKWSMNTEPKKFLDKTLGLLTKKYDSIDIFYSFNNSADVAGEDEATKVFNNENFNSDDFYKNYPIHVHDKPMIVNDLELAKKLSKIAKKEVTSNNKRGVVRFI